MTSKTRLVNFNGELIPETEAKISIYDLEEAIHIDFPSERDYDTLGGFILHELQSIPQENDIITFDGNIFSVQTITDNRIGKIKIFRK